MLVVGSASLHGALSGWLFDGVIMVWMWHVRCCYMGVRVSTTLCLFKGIRLFATGFISSSVAVVYDLY